MFMRFFTELREAKVPVTLKEYLALMEGLDKGVIDRTVDDFYYLSRAALVKDEKNLDKFDRVFGHVFKGLEKLEEGITADIPAEWLPPTFEAPETTGRVTAEPYAGVGALVALACRLISSAGRTPA